MKKITSKLPLLLFPVFAALMLQACFYGGPRPYYGNSYGYSAPAPVYAAPPQMYAYRAAPPPPPVVYGDWDAHHVWHDRDWWVRNNRPWVQQHHPQWLAQHPH